MAISFDDVIQEVHPFGRYQKRTFLLTCIIGIPSSLHTMITIFILAKPDHRCAVPGLDNDTWESQGPQHDLLVRNVIPLDSQTGKWSQCAVYVHRSAYNVTDPRNETGGCLTWVYSKEVFESTVLSELNLICDNKYKVALVNSVLMGGNLMGALLLGVLSDVVGHKKTLMIGVLGQIIVAFGTAFISNYIAFVVLRFLTSFFGMGMFISAYVAGMELVGPKQRAIAGIVIDLFWALGLFIILFLSNFLRNWHHLQIAASCMSLPFISYLWLIPESPRWLVSRGRIEEASAIVRHTARVNMADVSENILSLQDLKEKEVPNERLWHLFKNPQMMRRCLIIFFNWCTINMVFYGLSMYVSHLSGNLFLNFLYSSIAETLSYVFCLALLNRTGRRVLHCFSMLLGGVSCVAISFSVLFGNAGTQWTTISLSMIGKFGISSAFAIAYIFTAELFPTTIRNSAIAASSVNAHIGSIISFYIASLGDFVSGRLGSALPSLIFGGLSVTAGFASLWLPETFNHQLPETIEEAINFGRGESVHQLENRIGDLVPWALGMDAWFGDSAWTNDICSGDEQPFFQLGQQRLQEENNEIIKK